MFVASPSYFSKYHCQVRFHISGPSIGNIVTQYNQIDGKSASEL